MDTISDAVEYLIPEGISVLELAVILKKNNLQIHLYYGSGGFYCSLVENSGRHFVGYSYDIVESIRKALTKYDEVRTQEKKYREEEPTRPDFTLEDITSGRIR